MTQLRFSQILYNNVVSEFYPRQDVHHCSATSFQFNLACHQCDGSSTELIFLVEQNQRHSFNLASQFCCYPKHHKKYMYIYSKKSPLEFLEAAFPALSTHSGTLTKLNP